MPTKFNKKELNDGCEYNRTFIFMNKRYALLSGRIYELTESQTKEFSNQSII